MRVLYAIGYPQRFNGAQKSLMYLIKELPSRGVDPVVALTDDGICAEQYAANGIPIHVMRLPAAAGLYGKRWISGAVIGRLWRLLGSYPRILIRSWRLVGRIDPDIVHCNEPRALLFVGVAARLRRRSVVLHMRGSIDPYPRSLKLMIELIPHRILAVGPSIRSELSVNGQAKCKVVFNPVPAATVNERPQPPAKKAPMNVLALASIVPHKGHHHLIEAASLVNESGRSRDVEFRIFGQTIDVDYERKLRDRIRELELPNVHLMGWRSDVASFLRDAAVVVGASVDHERIQIGEREVEVANAEGTPRQLLEALIAEVPVVATRVPGVEDVIVHGETGLLVSPGSPRELADAILRLLDDPAFGRFLARNGKSVVERRHRPAKAAQEVAALYSELLAD